MHDTEHTNATDAWEARDFLIEHIDGDGLTAFEINETDNGEPRFALINPAEGHAWIVTVTPAELTPSGEDEGRAEPGAETNA